MIDTPVTICFVIPQNDNKKLKQKSFDDFNVTNQDFTSILTSNSEVNC